MKKTLCFSAVALLVTAGVAGAAEPRDVTCDGLAGQYAQNNAKAEYYLVGGGVLEQGQDATRKGLWFAHRAQMFMSQAKEACGLRLGQVIANAEQDEWERVNAASQKN